MSLFDKLETEGTAAVDEHGDKMEQGIDKGADVADDKTGGRYGEQIDAGSEKAKDALDDLDGKDDGDVGVEAAGLRLHAAAAARRKPLLHAFGQCVPQLAAAALRSFIARGSGIGTAERSAFV